jgi:methionine-R-sulfoxide reductase
MSYRKDPDAIKALTPDQFRVTQRNGTEPAFTGEYWDHHEPGIYVDVVSGEPLFASLDKFDSGTGWPSFFQPIDPEHIIEITDNSIPFMVSEPAANEPALTACSARTCCRAELPREALPSCANPPPSLARAARPACASRCRRCRLPSLLWRPYASHRGLTRGP